MPSTRRVSARLSSEAPIEAAPPAASATATSTASTKSTSRSTATASTFPAGPRSEAATATAATDEKDEPSTDAHLELLTEHFGFSPKVFVEALVYLSNEHLYKLAEQFEITAVDQLQHLEGGDLEAEQGVHAVLTLLENALDHTLDTFELYCLRSVFGVKARQARLMTLEHHRGLDLRRGKGAAEGSAKTNKSRKSIAAMTSANERSHLLGAEEDTLKRKLAAARSVRYDLLLGKQAAEARLAQTTLLHERFSAILSGSSTTGSGDDNKPHPDAGPSVTAVLGQHARKLRLDAEMLLKNLEQLRSEDPLGKPLLPAAAAAGGARETGRKGSDSGDEDAGTELRVWERGREAYLNWEAERMVAKVKGASDSHPAAARASAGDESMAADAVMASEEGRKTPKRKKAALTAPASSKRRAAATAAASVGGSRRRQPLDGDDGDDDAAEMLAATHAVGEAAEVDKVAQALRQRHA